eukprot:TRINITY_DN7924_c0_g1_i12.p1 TRINITY_DN7924_c0_g1~~TRINITY_DN7924_c0_g1_i12.p1  ORF type:complete len:879 (-),score=174.43 TRINITY_DN7924_c0_g1_i12:112-2748(-)
MRSFLALAILTFTVQSCLSISDSERVPCLPGTDESSCQNLGCIWEPTNDASPDCYLPQGYGYRATSDLYPVENGQAVDLERTGVLSMFGDDFDKLTLTFHEMDDDMLRIKIAPKDVERYEVPLTVQGSGKPLSAKKYSYAIENVPVFSFKVVRDSNGAVIFDTSLGGLTMADQFLQIAVKLASGNLYGFGEQEQPTLRHDMNWKTWGMFARDHGPDGNVNLYGVHPFYMNVESDGKTHGVLFLNSNAQEVLTTPAPGLVYRTIGGILDIYIYMGETPEQVVGQYTASVGRYEPPPYWVLGFQQCKWGYNTLDNMRAAWQRTLDSGIPFDAQWGDIDYMDRTLDFTTNKNEFGGLSAFVDEVHQADMKFVPILDPCISAGEPAGTYPPYDEGDKMDIWVKNASGDPLLAKVWPEDYCHFPDFFKKVTEEWWTKQLGEFHKAVEYDGIWIDMNEPANFVAGSVQGCQENKWNNPPYKPQTDGGDSLLDKTICMDAVQEPGLHYNVHSMYGWSEAQATNRALRTVLGKRPFILSRSTFVGSGKYTSHWLGDNFSGWDDMRYSIIGVLQYNMFGIPLVGADICGFVGNTTEEMCARWHQLGAFYPFSRNHNIIGALDQDPGSWGTDSLVARVARDAIKVKYSLLPYIYSQFYNSYNQGGTVARPLWHEFPTDEQALGVDNQFLLGPAVLISPILEEGAIRRTVYLPPGEDTIWYDAITGEKKSGLIEVESDLQNPSHTTPLHIRGGYILPIQDPETKNTVQQRATRALSLLVYLDSKSEARGNLYLDDGESDNFNLYSQFDFQAAPGVMELETVMNNYDDAQNWRIDFIRINGVQDPVGKVEINGESTNLFNYYPDMEILDILPQNLAITEASIITWQPDQP